MELSPYMVRLCESLAGDACEAAAAWLRDAVQIYPPPAMELSPYMVRLCESHMARMFGGVQLFQPPLEPSENTPLLGLETPTTRPEKRVAPVAARAPKRKAKRGRPNAKKTCIGRHAVPDLCRIHGSGTQRNQLIQNNGAAFVVHDPSACNGSGWRGVVHAVYGSTPAGLDTLVHDEAGSKLGTNAARNALAFAGKKAAEGLLQQFPWRIISHFMGGG